jgi:hypothetical protein
VRNLTLVSHGEHANAIRKRDEDDEVGKTGGTSPPRGAPFDDREL